VVDYHIYDLPSLSETFVHRNRALFQMMEGAPKPLVYVDTWHATDHDVVMQLHEQNLALEYEGSMVRNDGPYEFGKRSNHLQKLKNFIDSEYEVTAAEEGRGKDAGTVGAFVCRTSDGKQFKARLKATYERRRELFQHPEQWRDQLLTVTYQNLTADGVPRFPIGKGLRARSGD
jgi:DNA ligase-1